MAVTVLRFSVVAEHATAEARLVVAGALGGNADFTDPSPGSTNGSLVSTLDLPATYEPGVGRRDMLHLRRTEEGCGRAAADDGNVESEATTVTSLLATKSEDSHVPACSGNLDGTANRYNSYRHKQP